MLRKKILKGLAFSSVGFYALQATAALPPQYRKQIDLETMVAFVKQYPRVMSGLEIIDLGKKQVRFGKNCVLQFERPDPEREPGWAGPAQPLEFKSSSCDIGEREKTRAELIAEMKARAEKEEQGKERVKDSGKNAEPVEPKALEGQALPEE